MYKQKQILKQLKKIITKGTLKVNEPLKDHTTFKIGGFADFFVEPVSLEELIKLAIFLKENNIKHYILGNGSNVLASDDCFKGVIVKLGQNYSGITQNGTETLEVLAGTALDDLSEFACTNGLKGLEEASGIPGTVGGAVIMNASAYGYETSNVVSGVLAIVDGKITYFSKEECKFEYRKSIFNALKNVIILRVDFKLQSHNFKDLMKTRNEILHKRKTNQPLEYPSAGSVFKRVEGVIVSKLLDEQGFKGVGVNDAVVSTKHAGFIVNMGNATSKDVKQLIDHIKKQIKDRCDIILEEEVKYLE